MEQTGGPPRETVPGKPNVKDIAARFEVAAKKKADEEAAGKGAPGAPLTVATGKDVATVKLGEVPAVKELVQPETGKGAPVAEQGATAVKSENDNTEIIAHLNTLPACEVKEKITKENYASKMETLKPFFDNQIIDQYGTVKKIKSVINVGYSTDNMKNLNTALGDFRAEMNALK